MIRRVYLPSLLVLSVSAVFAQTPRPGPPQPARDTPAQQTEASAAPSGLIAGRVLAADTGRPVKRARVLVASADMPQGRAALTDDTGAFELTELPAGRYTLAVSKTGYIALSYGQRRPLQAGTPLQLADGQQLKGIEFRLPRGGALSGHVFDEDGDAMPGVIVRVMRYQYLQGDRRLVPVGGAQTDDRGLYRVWGLNPGDYYVSATTRGFNVPGRGPGGPGGGPGGGGGRPAIAGPLAGAAGNIAALFGQPGGDDEQVGYAPTYYPGVASVNEARPVTLGISQEALDIDFSLQLVRTSRVTGRVTNPDGSPTSNGNVTLAPDAMAGRGGQLGTNYANRIQRDGSFTITNVPPGRYTLRARGMDADFPQYASQPLTLAGGDVASLIVVLSPGASISGTVTFQATQLPVPADLSQVRITAPPLDQADFGPQSNTRAERDGRFTLDGVPAGAHFIRSNGAPRGWALKSVVVDGRDVIDSPIDVRGGQKLSGVSLVFTDTLTQVSGSVADEQGAPVTDYTVLAFPTDQSLWRPQARHIMTARPDQNGKYQIRGLPPGDYYVVTVDPTEPGEWFEPTFLDQHRAEASQISLGEGDVKTQDFRVSAK